MYAGTTRQIAFRGRLIEYLYGELKFIEEKRGQGEMLARIIVETGEERRLDRL
jgi:hypothetical protein